MKQIICETHLSSMIVCVFMSVFVSVYVRAWMIEEERTFQISVVGFFYENWNRYNISFVFVPKLVDICIIFEEKLLVYLFCLQNKWEKKEYDLLLLINNLELWLLGKNDGLEKLTKMDKHINIHCTKGCDSFIECIKSSVDMKMSSVFSERTD